MPVQSSILETTDVIYKPVGSVDQSDLEFRVPTDNDAYIDPNIKLYIRGKLTKANGTNLDETDFMAVNNNFVYSLFSPCNITLNGVTITPVTDIYNYRSFFETILTYGSDAVVSHLTNGFWYLDGRDLLPCDPMAPDAKIRGFVNRCNTIKQIKEVEMYGRLHSGICNVPRFLPPGVRIQIKLTKAKSNCYLFNKDAESNNAFKFLDAQLIVNRVRPNPTILLAHNPTLGIGAIASFNLTRVELKTFTFSSGSQSLSIKNAVLQPIPKRLLFSMVKNTDFLGSVTTNPYFFRHYDINHFALHVYGKKIPAVVLSFALEHEKTSVMGYRTLFKA